MSTQTPLNSLSSLTSHAARHVAGGLGGTLFREVPVRTPRESYRATEQALARARTHLISLQRPDGHWCAELQGDSILESEFILLKFILEQDHDPNLPLIANYLRSLQEADGGWAMYPGGKADLSGTVKAYFALKLMGDDPASPHMIAARTESTPPNI